jgi:hypothetical protein
MISLADVAFLSGYIAGGLSAGFFVVLALKQMSDMNEDDQ